MAKALKARRTLTPEQQKQLKLLRKSLLESGMSASHTARKLAYYVKFLREGRK